MWLLIALFLGGSLSLYSGAECLVRGSVAIALRFKIPTLIIGLTLVAFGTSVPELFVNIRGALGGHGDLSLGNVVGANLITIGCVLGFCAIIKPIRLSRQIVKWDIPVMILTTILALVLTFSGEVTRLKGAVFLSLFFLYILVLYKITRKGMLEEKEVMEDENIMIKESQSIARFLVWDLLLVIGGLILLFLGSRWLVNGALKFAHLFNINESIVGLTIVSLGTSLPELTTSLVAVFRKKHHIAMGTIIGSNIYNIMGVLGVGALVRPLHLEHAIIGDLSYLLLLQFFLFPIGQKRSEIPRWKGVTLSFLYFVYAVFIFVKLNN